MNGYKTRLYLVLVLSEEGGLFGLIKEKEFRTQLSALILRQIDPDFKIFHYVKEMKKATAL